MHIELDDYLELDLPTDEDLHKAENTLGVKFPQSYRQILKRAAGMSPDNLEPVTAGGRKLGFRCFNHVFLEDDEYHKVNVDELASWGYGNKLLEFADNGGGIRFCLDYRKEEHNPPVVIVYPWSEEGDEEAIEKMADNFEAFLDKFLV